MTEISLRNVQANGARGWKALQAAGAVYALGTMIHTFDHLRRGPESVTSEVRELGAVFTVAAVVVLALIFTRHRFAPLFAVLVGFSHGLGIVALHWLPDWSVVSDSFLTARAPLFSWVAVALEVAGAFAVGLVGFAMIQGPSRGGHLVWLIGLVAAVTVFTKVPAVVGVDWAVVRLLAASFTVFGVLVLALRLAPREWIPPGPPVPPAAVVRRRAQ